MQKNSMYEMNITSHKGGCIEDSASPVVLGTRARGGEYSSNHTNDEYILSLCNFKDSKLIVFDSDNCWKSKTVFPTKNSSRR